MAGQPEIVRERKVQAANDAHRHGARSAERTTRTRGPTSTAPAAADRLTPEARILGTATATIGTMIAVVIAYVTARQAVTGWRVLGFLATAPIAIPGIVLGVGLFLSYTRPPFVLYGTLWILLIAFVTIALPSAYQQLQAAFRTIHPELEDASRILGATRLKSLWQITAPLLRTGVIAKKVGMTRLFQADGRHALHARSRHHAEGQGMGPLQLLHHLGISLAGPVAGEQAQPQKHHSALHGHP